MGLLPQLLSGARGKITVNGAPIAFVTNVSVSRNHNVQPVHTFGAPNARSIEPLSYSCSVSIGTVIPVNDGSGKAVDSSFIGLGIVPTIQLMLQSEDVTVDLLDNITGATIASIRNCRPTSDSLSLPAAGLASGSLQLVGIYDAAGGSAPTQLGL